VADRQTDITTRSQAVARIADRTASQHLWGSRAVITQVTIWYSICYFLLVFLIGVTSLTFQSLLTSLVTWPFG